MPKKIVVLVSKCSVLGCRRRRGVLPRRFQPKGSLREVRCDLCEECAEGILSGAIRIERW